MKILDASKTTRKKAEAWAEKNKATKSFVGLAKLYWTYAPKLGIRPEIAYAQSALETAFGRFTGAVTPNHFNPCGLKVKAPLGDKPADFQRFPDWETGVIAHLDHLALYAGVKGYPKKNTPDPRHFSVILGRAASVELLSHTWAADPGYGAKIISFVNSIPTATPDPPPPAPSKISLVSRAQWGARNPKSTPSPLNPAKQEGAALHYMGGSNVYEKNDHNECAAVVRSIQNYHMDSNGWNDIAYNFLVCIHGYVFVGRGWGNRSAAQGSTYGNDSFHAFAVMVNDDPGIDFTPAAQKSIVYLINQLEIVFPSADAIRPHSNFFNTSCPGNEIRSWIDKRPWENTAPKHEDGFWKWRNWYDGRARYKGLQKDTDSRPDVPEKIPKKWWDKRKELLEKEKEVTPETEEHKDSCISPSPTP